ncbi:MAG TPA: OmpA family protein [Flavitalea sp.]|nr:OmpA family protein [Flavitalea sp.]
MSVSKKDNCSGLGRILNAAAALLTCLLTFWSSSYAQNGPSDTLLVFFEFDKSSLPLQELSKIDESVETWQRLHRKVLEIFIIGYADSSGTAGYNNSLSEARARYIEKYLSEQLRDSSIKFSMAAVGESQSGYQDDSLDRKVAVIPTFAPRHALDSITDYPLKLDQVIELSNIQFVEDQAYLTSQSLAAMPSYLAMLKGARYDKMHIVGYYNLDGRLLKSTDPRFILSKKRAKLIADYLIEAGLDPSKIFYEGAGNSRMVVEKPRTISQMRKNIRVEILLYTR